MEFVFRRKPARNRLAVFPGAFNPPTRAHEAMALAALAHAEEVVLTLSARMPHKPLDPSEVEQRLGWMRLLAEDDPRISVALCDTGLFVDMAREARSTTGVEQVSIVCGRDAAQNVRWFGTTATRRDSTAIERVHAAGRAAAGQDRSPSNTGRTDRAPRSGRPVPSTLIDRGETAHRSRRALGGSGPCSNRRQVDSTLKCESNRAPTRSGRRVR